VVRRHKILVVVFCALAIVGVAYLLYEPNRPSVTVAPSPTPAAPAEPEGTPKAESTPKALPSPKGNESKATPLPLMPLPPGIAPEPPGESAITDDDLDYLAQRHLLIPVSGVVASQLRDNFNEGRSEGRAHFAIDIVAPGGTPVVAVAEGTVLKLFQSDKGGITLYELDPSGRYVYYYAHLMRYEDKIAEGQHLRRGDLIGYVGDTGNAGAGNYHLHFAISKITSPRKWSGGDPINPYPFFVGK